MNIDIPEGMHVVQAFAPTTALGGAAVQISDYVEGKNAHTIWGVFNVNQTSSGSGTPSASVLWAEDVAGTGKTTATDGVKWWLNAACTTLDRLTASTASTALSLGATAVNKQFVVRIDPSAAATTQDCFAVEMSSADFAISGTWLLESRYPGYQNIIATTSST